MSPRHLLGLLALALVVPACGSSSGGGRASGFPAAPGGNSQVAQDAGGIRCVADGSGGAFLAWYESLSTPRIRVQRVDASGLPAWPALDLVGGPDLVIQWPIQLIADGSGAAVISWSIWSSGMNTFVQRISASGERLWGPNGLPVSSAWDPMSPKQLCSDGVGGVMLTWLGGYPVSSYSMVYAQRIDPNGVFLWTPGGVQTGSYQIQREGTAGWTTCSDGMGGLLMVWQEDPGDPLLQQWVDSTGAVRQGAGGRLLPGLTSITEQPKLYPVPGAGALLTWTDFRDLATTGAAIYLYHLDADGDPLDAPGGLKVAGNGSRGAYASLDGAGGAFIGYSRTTGDPTTRNVCLQRMDATGAMLWGADGQVVCSAPDTQTLLAIETWPAGGAVLLWEDFRSRYDYDLYAGRVNAAGVVLWEAALSAQPFDTGGPSAVGLGGGRLLAAWSDYREGPPKSQVCLQLVDPTGAGEPALPPARVEGPWYARNVPATLEPSVEGNLAHADDGQGGTLVVWTRDTGPPNYELDLHAQRLDASSQPLWGPNGIVLCSQSGHQDHPSIVADGAGGAFVAWSDSRNGTSDIYGQRVDSTGAKLWTPAGLPLRNRTDLHEGNPRAHADGAGGLYLAYALSGVGVAFLHVQRFDANGTALWAGDGPLIASGVVGAMAAVPDGAGGSIQVWTDARNSTRDLFAQRLNASGTPLWTAGGTSFVTGGTGELLRSAVPDGAGGVLVSWEEAYMSPGGWRRVDASGLWTWTSVDTTTVSPNPVCSGMEIVNDGAGGAFLLWRDQRSGGTRSYIQRINGAGSIQWTAGGVVLEASDWIIDSAVLAGDGAGGVYAAWKTTSSLLRMQRFDATGTRLWSSQGGVDVSTKLSSLSAHVPLLLAGPAGPRLAWPDGRRRTHNALYAQSLTPLGAPLP